MPRSTSPSRLVVAALLVAGSALLAIGCSSSDDGATPTTTAGSVVGSTPGTTASTVTDEERLAQAKTVAVGFFEAQAVNDHEQALERSSGAAALTIEWARAVNGIAAANDSGYQVPSVQAPNVRVQIDGLTADGADRWNATGFVELSFRPGPVVSTTSTTSAGGAAPTTAAAGSPATYAVDLVFSGEGEDLKLEDYRLDDVPYPVSQLFTRFETPTASASDVEGTVTLGHRDLDGSVQYIVELTDKGTAGATGTESSFTPAPAGTTGTVTVPAGADTVEGTTFADPLAAGASGSALIVFPGAFPGAAGTLTLAVASADATTTTTGGEPAALAWAVPEFPELTIRPVGTVTPKDPTSTSTSTSSTSSSTTTSSTPASSTTAPTTTPTTTGPTSTSTSTTSTSTTTTTAP